MCAWRIKIFPEYGVTLILSVAHKVVHILARTKEADASSEGAVERPLNRGKEVSWVSKIKTRVFYTQFGRERQWKLGFWYTECIFWSFSFATYRFSTENLMFCVETGRNYIGLNEAYVLSERSSAWGQKPNYCPHKELPTGTHSSSLFGNISNKVVFSFIWEQLCRCNQPFY